MTAVRTVPRHARARERAARGEQGQKWRLSWLSLLTALLATVGMGLFSYPSVAAWISQYNQSQIVHDYEEQVSHAKPEASDQVKQAHAYNQALSVGAVLEANTNVPTGDGTSSDETLRYNRILDANGAGLMARLRIPKIDLDLPIYHGTSEETLLAGLGHLEGTSLPVGGDSTRSVVTGHRGLANATMFTNLDQVEVGDTFVMEVFGEVLTYRVFDKQVVEPEDRVAPGGAWQGPGHAGHLHAPGHQHPPHPRDRGAGDPHPGQGRAGRRCQAGYTGLPLVGGVAQCGNDPGGPVRVALGLPGATPGQACGRGRGGAASPPLCPAYRQTLSRRPGVTESCVVAGNCPVKFSDSTCKLVLSLVQQMESLMRNALQTTGGAKAARGRKGWSLRRLRVAAAATAVLSATLVGTLLSPIGAPAEAGATTLEVQLGDTTVEVKKVTTVHTSSKPCLYYYGAGSATSTGTGPVKGSSGVYAAVSYGQPSVGNCPDDYGSSPENTGQTSMSLKPSRISKVNAGETFLIGTMRHINKPIYSGAADLKTNSAYKGEFRIQTAGTIDSVFPWTEVDTVNRCTAKLDENGHMVIGSHGGSINDRDRRVRTEYAFNLQKQVGPVGGEYIYDHKGTKLYQSGAGDYYFYTSDTTTLYDALGQACSDDHLTIKADRSETVWTDPVTRIDYQLKIWGFTFGGDNRRWKPTRVTSA